MAKRGGGAQSLADQVYAILRQRIVLLAMAPGEWFTERQISDETGYGAMPVREALDRLNHDGLIETIPRKGYKVASLTLKSVDDFFSVWRAVVPLILRLARERMTAEQSSRLAIIQKEHEKAIKGAPIEPDDWIRVSRARFDLLVEAASNPRLESIYRKLSAEMDRIFQLISRHGGGVSVILQRSSQFDAAIPSTEGASEFIEISRALISQIIVDKGLSDARETL